MLVWSPDTALKKALFSRHSEAIVSWPNAAEKLGLVEAAPTGVKQFSS